MYVCKCFIIARYSLGWMSVVTFYDANVPTGLYAFSLS